MGICTSDEKDNIHHENELKENTFENLKLFTFGNRETKCKVVDVYDGDTVTIVFFHNNTPIKVKFRMLGYDSPELKPLKNIENRDLHMKAADSAKNKLKEKVLNKILWVVFGKGEKDKFGREIGELYEISNPRKRLDTDVCINTWMVDNGFGKKFTGKEKKKEFSLQELNYIA